MSWDKTIRKCDNCWGEVRLYFGDYINENDDYYLEAKCGECRKYYSHEDYNKLYLFREISNAEQEYRRIGGGSYRLETPLKIICSKCKYDTGTIIFSLSRDMIHTFPPCDNCFKKDETIHCERIYGNEKEYPEKIKARIYWNGIWEWYGGIKWV